MKRLMLILGAIMLFAIPAQASDVTVLWTSPGDDGNVGTATSYDIRYSLNTITDTNWSAATLVAGEPSPKIAGSDETHTITGLGESTVYFFAIKATDEVGNESGLSNVLSVTTGDNTAPAAIVDFRNQP